MTVHFESIEKSEKFDFRPVEIHEPDRGFSYKQTGKRALDLALVAVSAPIVVPLILIVTVALVLCGHRPFYVQRRIGQGGRIFNMWKFRTMIEDAESALRNHLENNADARAEWDVHQKLKSDPRVTFVGRILRKSSLDELPQLWNVVTGDMSLVGPRPIMVDQEPMYPGHAYYRMRPGITGFWQISDRNDCEFKARAMHDAVYEAELSLMTDLRVLTRTVGVVLRGTGY